MELNLKSIFLFFFYGMTVYFINVYLSNSFTNNFLDFLVATMMLLFLGTLFSLILHKINIWLKGTASFADTFSILSHATIPITISLMVIFFSKYMFLKEIYFNWSIIFYIGLTIGFKILIQGFLKYNHSEYSRTVINISPIILLYLGFFGVRIYDAYFNYLVI